ncbi:MAG TPA: hypothetical protein VET48_00400, partial [Steroidobacteraceae bacterium]|nr:hypothetical protein [Steroidobacteraceae bacterium]
MKYLILVLFAGALASCNAPSDPAANSSAAPADQYFYPPTNGMRYIYAQDGSTQTSIDTSTYQVVVGSTYDSYAKLIEQNVSGNSTGVLY